MGALGGILSCLGKVTVQVRIFLVPLQIVPGDKVLNPLLYSLEVGLNITQKTIVNTKLCLLFKLKAMEIKIYERLDFTTLNMRPSCSTHSMTSCWWPSTLRLFIIRTIEASMAYLLSLSTSSTTFFFSSTGGSGICNQRIQTLSSSLDWTKSNLIYYSLYFLCLVQQSWWGEVNCMHKEMAIKIPSNKMACAQFKYWNWNLIPNSNVYA